MKNKDGLTFGKRLKIYIRKNAFALAVSGCAVCLVVALAVTAIVKTNQRRNQNLDVTPPSNIENAGGEMSDINQDTQNTPTSSDDLMTFVMPIQNYTLGTTFVNNDVVYNETMNEWTAHVGVDFVTEGAQEVFAIADGTIESINYSPLEGTIVAIKHSDELVSVYKSLAEDLAVEVGDTIKAGEKIGSTSSDAGNEAKLGSHLHLELLENGKAVNPFDYISDK